MEALKRVGLFPGCSLEGTAGGFLASLEAVFSRLGIECKEVSGWNCCGATSAHALDHDLHLSLNLRNLAQAQDQGFEEILAPCAACYHRLAQTQLQVGSDEALLGELNEKTCLEYKGNIAVRNVLHFLAEDVGVEAIAPLVSSPLSGLKTVCYYGCLNTRIPHADCFDDREYPMSMDRIVQCLGAQSVDWSYKTDCCGASMFITAESTSAKLVAKILKDAVARAADCIVVACPMCHNNLDTKQDVIRAQYGIERPVPIMFLTQLMGLAFGVSEDELKLHQSFVPFRLAR